MDAISNEEEGREAAAGEHSCGSVGFGLDGKCHLSSSRAAPYLIPPQLPWFLKQLPLTCRSPNWGITWRLVQRTSQLFAVQVSFYAAYVERVFVFTAAHSAKLQGGRVGWSSELYGCFNISSEERERETGWSLRGKQGCDERWRVTRTDKQEMIDI